MTRSSGTPATTPAPVRLIESTAPSPRFARGWHCLGLDKDFRDGRPHQINAFGGQLVVWEDTTGQLNVLDSYCRHMGGDLSKGTIKGDEIACPFHDWRWGGDGKCKEIPYAKRVPLRARTQTWPTLVRNGMLFVWNDPENGEPEDYIPAISGVGSDDWTEWVWSSVLVEDTNCRELVDNVVDMAHFFYVHFNIPLSFRNVFEGTTASQYMTFTPRRDKRTLDFGEESITESSAWYFGPSFMIDEFKADVGADDPLEAVLINCHYPVTNNSFVLQYGIMVKRMSGMSTEVAEEAAQEFGRGTMATFEQDITIWRDKTRIDNPLLCEDDGPVYQLRRWYEQFYVDIDDITDDMTNRFEFDIDTTNAVEGWQTEVDDILRNEPARQ